MNEIVLQQILEKHQTTFIDSISRELENSHDKWFDGFGFPIFGTTSKDYHEQVYFQSYLESYTRKMINGILKDMLDDLCEDYRWPEFEYPGVYNGYTNSEAEKEFGFEFVDNIDKVGYRYAFFSPDEINSLKETWKINEIVLIQWQDDAFATCIEYDDSTANVITPLGLFRRLFFDISQEELLANYDMFIKCVQDSVTKANMMISLVTLPGFTPAYIHKAREKIATSLRKEIVNLSAFSVYNEDFNDTGVCSKSLIEKYNLHRVFLDNNYEQAFIGTSPYAKSFMTSEYLYCYFKDNPLFDYTPIVSGYIKSVEQLLNAVCGGFCKAQRIKAKIRAYTLGEYSNFLDAHDVILRQEFQSAKAIIVECLNSYTRENRNHLFHKDYFDDWNRVITIRKNTIFLYTVILGATDPKFLNEKQASLGILHMDYDRLFGILDSQDSGATYCFLLRGMEYSNMQKDFRHEGICYDKYSLVCNSLTFRRYDYDGEIIVTISPKNIPSEIWTTNIQGEKIKKLWPDEMNDEDCSK